MSTLNQVGIIVLIIVIVISAAAKYYTRKKLKEIDGLGAIHKRESEDDKGIYI